MKSSFDSKWQEKRMIAANDPSNPFNPFSNDDHFVWAALENVMYEFNTRGCLEPSSICVEDFITGTIEDGAYKDIPFVRLKENYSGQKGKALSLRNPVLDADNTKKKTFECPYSADPLSTYQTTLKLMEWVPSTCEGGKGGRRIFRKKASIAELAEWKEAGLNWRLSSKASRVIGRNQVNKILKQIALWCAYDNAHRCTSQGKRRSGISQCANAGVAPAVLKMCGGHTSLDMVATYHGPDQKGFDGAIKAKHGSPSKIWEQMAESNNPMASDDDDSTLQTLRDIDSVEFAPPCHEDSKPPAASSIPFDTFAAGNDFAYQDDTLPFDDTTNVASKKKKKKKKRTVQSDLPVQQAAQQGTAHRSEYSMEQQDRHHSGYSAQQAYGRESHQEHFIDHHPRRRQSHQQDHRPRRHREHEESPSEYRRSYNVASAYERPYQDDNRYYHDDPYYSRRPPSPRYRHPSPRYRPRLPSPRYRHPRPSSPPSSHYYYRREEEHYQEGSRRVSHGTYDSRSLAIQRPLPQERPRYQGNCRRISYD